MAVRKLVCKLSDTRIKGLLVLLLGSTLTPSLLLSLTAQAQTPQQLRSCRDFVGSALELVNPVPLSSILVNSTGAAPGTAGDVTLNWQLRDGSASGSCLVDNRGEVLEYRRNRRSVGSNPAVDYGWGQEVSPYTAQIAAGQAAELLSRPNNTEGRPVALVNGGETVTVSRTYNGPDGAWVLVRGARNQEGWLSAPRVVQTPTGMPAAYGANPSVEYQWGQEVRPLAAQVSLGNSIGQIIFGSVAYELVNRPVAGPTSRSVGTVAGGERVMVYRTYQEGNTTWALVKGSRGQEGWIIGRRLVQL